MEKQDCDYFNIIKKLFLWPILRRVRRSLGEVGSFSKVGPFLTKKTNKEGEITLICVNKDYGYKSS